MITPFEMSGEELQGLLAAARGDTDADLVLRDCRLVNVLTGEMYWAEIAVWGGRVAGVSTRAGEYRGRASMEMQGRYVAPGLIDGHVHIESSLLVPAEFANAVLPRGTTSVVSDPHEIANVHGVDGVRFMLAASEGLPLRVFAMLSSCVPATDMETAGAELSASDLEMLLGEPRVLGVAELMNYPRVVAGGADVLAKARLGHRARLRVDGHAPMLSGKHLQAYAAAGVASDHESTTAEEAMEKLRAGLHVLIREGSTARNLDALAPLVNERTARFCSFATDDKQPDDLARDGHIDHVVRRAVARGIDPVAALTMASLNTARHYGLNDLGAIAPGYHADMIVFSDLVDIRPDLVFAGGKLVARGGSMIDRCTNKVQPPPNKMLVRRSDAEVFAVRANGRSRARLIVVLPEQIVTTAGTVELDGASGYGVPCDREVHKIAVLERHRGTGNVGVGFVEGFKLEAGALASSVAHDSHNVVVVGCGDEEMSLAVETIVAMGGGLCAVNGETVLATLPLPVAGLMSLDRWEDVRARMETLLSAARELGCTLSNPYMAMAFLALPVIPALKLTDRGLVDVDEFRIVPLLLEKDGE